MSRKLPQVSGKALIAFLQQLGYQTVRQRGSHIRIRKITPLGEHNVTIPNHKIIAKGTLNDIISKVSLWNDITKETFLKRMTE